MTDENTLRMDSVEAVWQALARHGYLISDDARDAVAEALAAKSHDDGLLREARDFLLDTQGTDSVGHRLALRIDTALAPTTQSEKENQ